MKAFIIILFSLFPISLLRAQPVFNTITAVVKTDKNSFLNGAGVSLTKMGDSIPVARATSDNGGRFMLDKISTGSYTLNVRAIGYQLYAVAIVVDGARPHVLLPDIILISDGKTNLNEVVIKAKLPLMQMEADKTVVNVEAMISSASSNALEVLEKTPGITISANGAIALNGRPGVLVLLDGRPTYMSGQDLSNYLKSIPGANLDKIELIDNPSARYDASGNAVINIRRKKNRAGGFTGSVSAGITFGRYTRSNNSLNLNYNRKKINIYGSMGYSYDKNYTDDDFDRRFYNAAGEPTSFIDLINNQVYSGNALNGNLGLDFSASENTTYGFQVNVNENDRKGSVNYTSENFSSGLLDSSGRGDITERNNRTNLGSSFSFIHKFDNKGKDLSADVNYLDYDAKGEQSLQNYFYQADGALNGEDAFLYHLPATIHIYTMKADYVHALKDKARLEAGFKSSRVSNNNISDYYQLIDNQQLIDNSRSNHFKYKEYINAAYLNSQKSWKYWSVQLGLRVENTVARGEQMGNAAVTGSSFRKNYTKLFPAVFLSYKLDTSGKNSLAFAITRRINRPNYQLLNEFLFFRDQYSYTNGNSMLNPQYQNRYEIKYQYKQLLRMGLSYNRFTDVIFQTTRVEGDHYITSPQNIASGYMYLLSTGISAMPAKWWNLYMDILLSKVGLNGDNYGVPLNPETYMARINVLNQFQFGAGWSAELSGYYASRDLNGQTYTAGMYRVNTGVQKKVLKGQGSVRFGADDIFHSWVYKNRSLALYQADYLQNSSSDTQRFGFAFTYRFGKDTFARKSKHQNNALDEEKGRM